MPNCFQLFKKDSDVAAILQDIDSEICALVGKEVHPKRWHWWYDTIGYMIACHDLALGSQELRDKVDKWFEDPKWFEDSDRDEAKKVLKFLEENYSSRSFYQR